MTYRLFIDDLRDPVADDWVVVRTSEDAIEYVASHGIPYEISFDHDLGGEDTSRRFVHWLSDELVVGRFSLPVDFVFGVHSQNYVGARWLVGTMNSLIRHFTNHD